MINNPDFIGCYKKSINEFMIAISQLNKELYANFVNGEKIPENDFDVLYTVRNTLERIYTWNLERLQKITETGHLSDAHKERALTKTESMLTDLFYNIDRYDDFCHNRFEKYINGSFINLIDTLNFDNKGSMFKYNGNSLSVLDRLSDPYLRVIKGIYEYFKNDLIKPSLLEERIKEADVEYMGYFELHKDNFTSQNSPRVLSYSKNGGGLRKKTLPEFFYYVSDYVTMKLHASNPNEFDDKIELIEDINILGDAQKNYMDKVLGNEK